MSSVFEIHENEVIIFNCDNLPKATWHEWRPLAGQIAAYLSHLLEKHQEGRQTYYLQLPSIVDLTGHFRCCETDIFDALLELKKHDYRYEIQSIDGPIKLMDPLSRKSLKTKRWHVLSKPTQKQQYPAAPGFLAEETKEG